MQHKITILQARVQGYSLVEVVIVLACGAILLVVATPNLHHLQQEWALWESARVLETSLHWGRMYAISANAPIMFEVSEDGQRFYWVDPASGDKYENTDRHLSGQIRIVGFPKRPIRLYQHGNAVPAGTYILCGETGSYRVVVSPGGRIRLQKD